MHPSLKQPRGGWRKQAGRRCGPAPPHLGDGRHLAGNVHDVEAGAAEEAAARAQRLRQLLVRALARLHARWTKRQQRTSAVNLPCGARSQSPLPLATCSPNAAGAAARACADLGVSLEQLEVLHPRQRAQHGGLLHRDEPLGSQRVQAQQQRADGHLRCVAHLRRAAPPSLVGPADTLWNEAPLCTHSTAPTLPAPRISPGSAPRRCT